MACRTGLACGLTLTLSSQVRLVNHSAVMIETIEALLAWWPPTLRPEPSSGRLLADCTMLVASHSTRRSTSISTSSSAVMVASVSAGRIRAPGAFEIVASATD